MATVPVFGHAVQEPAVTPPKATPCVTASQVAPRPQAAASAKVKINPISSRTKSALERVIAHAADRTSPHRRRRFAVGQIAPVAAFLGQRSAPIRRRR